MALRAAGVLGLAGVSAVKLKERALTKKGLTDPLQAVKNLYTQGVSPERQVGRAVGKSKFEVARGFGEGVVGQGVATVRREAPVYGKLARREVDRGVVRHNRAVSNLQRGVVVKGQQVQAQMKTQARQAQKRASTATQNGWSRDRAARQKLGQKAYLGLRKSIFGFSRYPKAYVLSLPALATFGKPLSKAHKQKISRSLKNRSRGKKKTRAERSLVIREQEARSRSLRNVGYITNSVSDAVREARLTARYLGFGPRKRKSSGLLGSGRRVARGFGEAAGYGSNITGGVRSSIGNVISIGRLVR